MTTKKVRAIPMTIQIALYDPTKRELKPASFLQVEGIAVGDLFVHEDITYDERGWSVAHTNTGCAIAKHLKKRNAMGLARDLQRFSWGEIKEIDDAAKVAWKYEVVPLIRKWSKK